MLIVSRNYHWKLDYSHKIHYDVGKDYIYVTYCNKEKKIYFLHKADDVNTFKL